MDASNLDWPGRAEDYVRARKYWVLGAMYWAGGGCILLITYIWGDLNTNAVVIAIAIACVFRGNGHMDQDERDLDLLRAIAAAREEVYASGEDGQLADGRARAVQKLERGDTG